MSHVKFGRLKSSETCILLKFLKKYPIIWNINLKEYSNKPLRDGHIKMLLFDLKKNNISMSKHEFQLRFRNIKDSYRRQLQKVNNSKKTNPNSLYTPKLYWFKEANSFLRKVVLIKNHKNHKKNLSPNMQDENRDDPVKESQEEFCEEFENYEDTKLLITLESCKKENKGDVSEIIDNINTNTKHEYKGNRGDANETINNINTNTKYEYKENKDDVSETIDIIDIDETIDNIIQQKRDDEVDQGKRNIPDDILGESNNNRQVKQDLRKQSTSPTLGSNSQSMEHLDNIVSKTKNIGDENYQYGRYVASQLDCLSPIWSVTLRSEIQAVIEQVVRKSLSDRNL